LLRPSGIKDHIPAVLDRTVGTVEDRTSRIVILISGGHSQGRERIHQVDRRFPDQHVHNASSCSVRLFTVASASPKAQPDWCTNLLEWRERVEPNFQPVILILAMVIFLRPTGNRASCPPERPPPTRPATAKPMAQVPKSAMYWYCVSGRSPFARSCYPGERPDHGSASRNSGIVGANPLERLEKLRDVRNRDGRDDADAAFLVDVVAQKSSLPSL